MILKSGKTGRKIEILDEDEKFYYFFWFDHPNVICNWQKNTLEQFFEYFLKI